MNLYTKLQSEIVNSTLKREELKKNSLKSVLSSVQQTGDFSDDSVRASAMKLTRQLNESLQYFTEEKTRENLQMEISFISDYCPVTASKEEIIEFVNSHTHELGLLSGGAKVGYVVKNIGKKVDGKLVKEIVG